MHTLNNLSPNIKNILIVCGVASDGIGDAAAAKYVAHELLTNYDVNVSVAFAIRGVTDSRTLMVAEGIRKYIQDIDTNGWIDLQGVYYSYKNKFHVILVQDKTDKDHILTHSYDIVLKGPHFGIPGLYPPIPLFEFREFINSPYEEPDLCIGGIGEGTCGIYFDSELWNTSLSHELVSKIQKDLIDYYKHLLPNINLTDIDVYMAYGRYVDLTEIFINFAKLISGEKIHIIFMRKEDYIDKYHDSYKQINSNVYINNNTILVAGYMSELNFRRCMLVSNKIVYCTGNSSVSQALSSQKIVIYDYLPYSEYFIKQLYKLMENSGMQIGKTLYNFYYNIFDINVTDKNINSNTLSHTLYLDLMKDLQNNNQMAFFQIIHNNYQIINNIVPKISKLVDEFKIQKGGKFIYRKKYLQFY